MFFDVCREWDEVLINECRDLIVAVRFGFQPNTCASSRRRTEIDEQRLLAVFGFGECRVSIFNPIYFHSCLLFSPQRSRKSTNNKEGTLMVNREPQFTICASCAFLWHFFFVAYRVSTVPLARKPISRAGSTPKSSTSQVLPPLSLTLAAGISVPSPRPLRSRKISAYPIG
jgi:hypothetical protein